MKKNKKVGNFISIFFEIVVPCFLMIYLGMIPYFNESNGKVFFINAILIPLFGFYLVFIFSIIFHEFGHLIFGIISKLVFVEFNFLFFSFYKENKQIKFKFKKPFKGTAGHCLMDFPDGLNFMDFKLYAIGGIVFNLFLTIISLILIFIFELSFVRLILLYVIFINFGLALSNIIPFELNGVDTDGAKIYKMKNDLNYINNSNKLYKVSKLLREGVTIDKISSELIYKPQKIEYQSDLDAMNIYINKLMYLKKYDEAEKLLNQCMSSSIILSNTRNNLKITLIDLYLYTDRFDKIGDIYDDDLFKFVSSLTILEKGLSVYSILYYVLKKDKDRVKKLNEEFLKYINSLDKKSQIYIELNCLYDHIKDKI